MNEASSLGLNWVDGLQYVVDKRNRLQAQATNSLEKGEDTAPNGSASKSGEPDGKL